MKDHLESILKESFGNDIFIYIIFAIGADTGKAKERV